MGFRGGAEYVYLLDGDGHIVEDPFLPLDVALWNGDRTRYTLLFDTLGASSVESCPTSGWGGRSLRVSRTRSSSIGSGPTHPGCRWSNRSAASSRSARQITVPSIPPSGRYRRRLPGPAIPLSCRGEGRSITLCCSGRSSVATARGEVVDGDTDIGAAETRWIFTPREPWGTREYRLVVLPILEDPAGNQVGRPFETASSEGTGQQGETAGASVPFLPRPHAR